MAIVHGCVGAYGNPATCDRCSYASTKLCVNEGKSALSVVDFLKMGNTHEAISLYMRIHNVPIEAAMGRIKRIKRDMRKFGRKEKK